MDPGGGAGTTWPMYWEHVPQISCPSHRWPRGRLLASSGKRDFGASLRKRQLSLHGCERGVNVTLQGRSVEKLTPYSATRLRLRVSIATAAHPLLPKCGNYPWEEVLIRAPAAPDKAAHHRQRKGRRRRPYSPQIRSLCYAGRSEPPGQLSSCKTSRNSTLDSERDTEGGVRRRTGH